MSVQPASIRSATRPRTIWTCFGGLSHCAPSPSGSHFRPGQDFWDLLDAMTKKRRDHRPRSTKEALDWIQNICVRDQVI